MLRILSTLSVLCLAAYVYSTCTDDTQCPSGCCHMDRVGSRCHNYSMQSEACHLPNVTVKVMLYPCGCAQGLTCDKIHFDTSLPDAVHQAELLLLGHGYGICTDTPGTIFGK